MVSMVRARNPRDRANPPVFPCEGRAEREEGEHRTRDGPRFGPRKSIKVGEEGYKQMRCPEEN